MSLVIDAPTRAIVEIQVEIERFRGFRMNMIRIIP